SDGAELWRRSLPEGGYNSGTSTTPIVFNNLLIVRRPDGILALDRFTLDSVWGYHNTKEVVYYWSEFVLDGGRLYVALDLIDGSMGGTIVALDAATGSVIWKTLIYQAPDRALIVSPT